MQEDRIKKAVDNFGGGCNCAQAVVAAFADLYGMDEATVRSVAVAFGGGIGRMRQTCGAACGMFMLAGMDKSKDGVTDKNETYKAVQALARKFKEENGSLNCGELLGLVPVDPPLPKKRPCSMMVETAARLFAEYLANKPK